MKNFHLSRYLMLWGKRSKATPFSRVCFHQIFFPRSGSLFLPRPGKRVYRGPALPCPPWKMKMKYEIKRFDPLLRERTVPLINLCESSCRTAEKEIAVPDWPIRRPFSRCRKHVGRFSRSAFSREGSTDSLRLSYHLLNIFGILYLFRIHSKIGFIS